MRQGGVKAGFATPHLLDAQSLAVLASRMPFHAGSENGLAKAPGVDSVTCHPQELLVPAARRAIQYRDRRTARPHRPAERPRRSAGGVSWAFSPPRVLAALRRPILATERQSIEKVPAHAVARLHAAASAPPLLLAPETPAGLGIVLGLGSGGDCRLRSSSCARRWRTEWGPPSPDSRRLVEPVANGRASRGLYSGVPRFFSKGMNPPAHARSRLGLDRRQVGFRRH